MLNRNKHIDAARPATLMGGGFLASFASLIGASCCVLPLLLFNLGVSSAVISQLGFFARYRDWFLYGALGLALTGLVTSFRNGRRPSVRMLLLFGGTLLLVIGGHFVPLYEYRVLSMLGFLGGR